jgi:cell wall-associated NlpC family hydrolase
MLKIKPKIEKIKNFFIFDGPIEKSWAVALVVALSITTCSASAIAQENPNQDIYTVERQLIPFTPEFVDGIKNQEKTDYKNLIATAQLNKELEVSVSSSLQRKFIDKALTYKNTGRWVFGGSTPGWWDCSGFIMYVARHSLDVELYHSATSQMESGFVVKEPLIGDLVGLYYRNTSTMSSHIGIYVGNGNFIHVSETRGTVVDPISNYEDSYDVRYSRFIEKSDRWTAKSEVDEKLEMHAIINGQLLGNNN